MDIPQYTLRPNTNRMVAPWIFKLLALAVLFYLGVYFNVKYVLDYQIPPAVNLLIFLVLVVMIVIQLILYHVKYGKYAFKFYPNRVDYEAKKTKTFLFSDFSEVKLKQTVFDKMFNTGQIVLSKDFDIGPISNVAQIQNYIQKLVQYYKYTQQQFQMRQSTQLRQPQQSAQVNTQVSPQTSNQAAQTMVRS